MGFGGILDGGFCLGNRQEMGPDEIGTIYGAGEWEDIYEVYGLSHSEECEAISKDFFEISFLLEQDKT